MPDSPDYSKYQPGSVRFSLQDMGELAVRMGSPVIFDRRGDTIIIEQFAHGIASWQPSASGTGGSTVLDATYNRMGSYVAKLTAGADTNKWAHMTKSFWSYGGGRIGVTFVFGIINAFSELWLQTTDVRNNVYTEAFMHVINSGGKVQIKDQAGVYQTIITGLALTATTPLWIPLKLVFDPDTGQYIRLITSAGTVDISAYSISQGALSGGNKQMIDLYFIGPGGTNPVMYFSDIILTANEP